MIPRAKFWCHYSVYNCLKNWISNDLCFEVLPNFKINETGSNLPMCGITFSENANLDYYDLVRDMR